MEIIDMLIACFSATFSSWLLYHCFDDEANHKTDKFGGIKRKSTKKPLIIFIFFGIVIQVFFFLHGRYSVRMEIGTLVVKDLKFTILGLVFTVVFKMLHKWDENFNR